MTVNSFPITKRWPAKHPEIIQLYSAITPNALKVALMLGETGLPYEAHYVSLGDGDQKTEAFLSLNPNGKIPAIIDPHGPDGQPLALWESGAILMYLSQKTGQFMPSDARKQAKAVQWLMWQMGSVGPMFGQFGFFFKTGGAHIEDKRPLQRYQNETSRLLRLLDQHLDDRANMLGDDYSIVDMATWPWMVTLIGFYEAGEAIQFHQYENINRWLESCKVRQASIKASTLFDR